MHDEAGCVLKMDEPRNGPPLGRRPISLSWGTGQDYVSSVWSETHGPYHATVYVIGSL